WLLKDWGRTLSLALVSVWLIFGLMGLLRHAGPIHIARVVIDAAAVTYLTLPPVRRLFTTTLVPAKKRTSGVSCMTAKLCVECAENCTYASFLVPFRRS